MAVPAGPTEQRYTGNGVSTIFAVPFLVIQASDLAVYLDGVRQIAGYMQSGVGNPTSTVTFTTAPVLNAQILLALEVPFERLNDYQENGDFLSSTVNRDFDRIWQALKQLLRFSGRALTLGQFDIDGQGWYRAKGNGIRNLRDPVQAQDAATMGWTDRFVGGLISAIQGPINNAANIFYLGPDGSPHVVQDLSSELGSSLVCHLHPLASAVKRTVRDALADVVSIMNWIPESEHAAIRDRTTTYDCGADVRRAIADVPAGTRLYFPWGLYLMGKASPASADVLSVNKSGIELVGEGTLRRAPGNTGYFIRVAADDVKLRYLEIDGNRGAAGIPDSPGFGSTIRSVGFVRGVIENCRIINSAGQGIGCGAGCHYWKVSGNYFENFFSTAVQFAAEKTDLVGCNYNAILFNLIKGDLPSVMRFCNGIFVTTSATTEAQDTHFNDGNIIIGNIVEDVPDTGIEAGYKCRYTVITGNVVRRSFNSNILVRDNRHFVVANNNIFCRNSHGSTFKHGLYVDGFSIPGDTAPVTTAYGTVTANNIVGAEQGGLSVVAAEHCVVTNNSMLGLGNANGSTGMNIKAGRCTVSQNRAIDFQFLYRISLESSRPLGNVINTTKVKDNFGQNGMHGIMLDATTAMTLNNCDIVSNRFEVCTNTTVGLSGTPALFNTRVYDNIDKDNPQRTMQTQAAVAGAILSGGVERGNSSTQFGEIAVFDRYAAGIVSIRMGNEVAVFKIDSDGAITALSESANIGVASGSKAYRLEASTGAYVIKRYGASQLYASFKASLL